MAREKLASERVIINAPMSFAGASQRAWRIGGNLSGVPRIAVVAVLVIPLLMLWWFAIVSWSLLFGLFLVPYRLLRRGVRKRKAEALRHRETLGAINAMRSEKDEKRCEGPRCETRRARRARPAPWQAESPRARRSQPRSDGRSPPGRGTTRWRGSVVSSAPTRRDGSRRYRRRPSCQGDP
jgi:hypothetical protein